MDDIGACLMWAPKSIFIGGPEKTRIKSEREVESNVVRQVRKQFRKKYYRFPIYTEIRNESKKRNNGIDLLLRVTRVWNQTCVRLPLPVIFRMGNYRSIVDRSSLHTLHESQFTLGGTYRGHVTCQPSVDHY